MKFSAVLNSCRKIMNENGAKDYEISELDLAKGR